MAEGGACVFIIFPRGAGEVAADDSFYGEGGAFGDDHAARHKLGMVFKVLVEEFGVIDRDVIWCDVGCFVKPEEAHLG